MGPHLPPRPLAVYLHIPFCLSRCGYCSFFSLPYGRAELEGYLGFLQREIDLWLRRDPSLALADTLYFGGGTPSLLSPGQINSLCERFSLSPGAEVTLEINPLQITAAYLAGLRRTPVNRLSIGLQSLDDWDLEFLDRRHRAEQIPAKIKLCREFGYRNLSLDLIYGLPGSSVESLLRNVERYLRLAPEHISCYLLTLDDDSPLCQLAGGIDQVGLPGDDEAADQYYALRGALLDAGFEQYEISNFSLAGKASRHNLAYWRSEPWLGLGPSAAGWLPPLRYANPADMSVYRDQINREEVMPEAENCAGQRARDDYLMMGLRLTSGVSFSEYANKFGTDLRQDKRAVIDKLLGLGLVETDKHCLRLSPKGLFISNSVIGELL